MNNKLLTKQLDRDISLTKDKIHLALNQLDRLIAKAKVVIEIGSISHAKLSTDLSAKTAEIDRLLGELATMNRIKAYWNAK